MKAFPLGDRVADGLICLGRPDHNERVGARITQDAGELRIPATAIPQPKIRGELYRIRHRDFLKPELEAFETVVVDQLAGILPDDS